MLRNVVGAVQPVGRDADVHSARSEGSADALELLARIVGVEMLHELVAVGYVHAGRRHRHAAAIREDQGEVGRKRKLLGDLLGDVEAVYLADPRRHGDRERAVAGADLEEHGVGPKVSSQDPKLGA